MAYMGKMLRVNLSDKSIKKEEFPKELAKKYLGGRGLASKILFDEVDPKVEPLAPENKLIFATGPLTLTNAPTGGRYMVITKGPLTGGIASSNSGGFFGAKFKATGYDMIIFEGKSEKPAYLFIDDTTVELRDASHVWGKGTEDTTDILTADSGHNKANVACIGPAGENLSNFAAIINEKTRAAGRTGVGAVMGSKGVKVIEYESDYSKAVEEGRRLSNSNPMSYFIDDENSKDLFLGYSVAAIRLKKQLEEMNIVVDSKHPLFVYLPCGVCGGPGGVAFGLKLLFKDNVHCFFAEPTHSPCMLLGLLTDKHNEISVQDFGIDNITEADGLAVGRPSGFVGKTLKNLISGVYTVEDDKLYRLLSTLADCENIYLEPSALAGIPGVIDLLKSSSLKEFLRKNELYDKMTNATHIAWATGGSLVPKEIMNEYYNKIFDLNKLK